MKREILSLLEQARAAKRPVVLATDLLSGDQCLLDGDAANGSLLLDSVIREEAKAALRSDKSRTITDDQGRSVFLNAYNPPLRMMIIGAVHISQALAPMAAMAGYDVTVIDPRGSFATEERFPGVAITGEWPDEALDALTPDTRSAIVTLTHDPKLDDPALERALNSSCFYIGSLGSRKTHAARVERLTALGFEENTIARINGPIGLNIGAKSPAEIAIAIMAQVTTALRQAPESAA